MRASNPDVNEIIVKIEMKKFQNLIESRIKHKNNLLQADMKRVYPLTKKTHGGLTLYDQNRPGIQGSPRKGRGKKKNETREAYGTDEGNTSGEDYVAADKSVIEYQNTSLNRKADSKLNQSSTIGKFQDSTMVQDGQDSSS